MLLNLGYLSKRPLLLFVTHPIQNEQHRAQSELDPHHGYDLIVVVLMYSHHLLNYSVDDQSTPIHRHYHLVVQHANMADYFPHPTLNLVVGQLQN